MAVDVVQDVSRGLANKSSAGDIAKDLGTSAVFNVGVAGLLEGLPGVIKAKKTTKAAKETAEAAKKANAEKIAKETVENLNEQVSKNLTTAKPTLDPTEPMRKLFPDAPIEAVAKTDIPVNSIDDIVSQVGEKKVIDNYLDSTSDIKNLSNTFVEVNGSKVSAKNYMDAFEKTLPDDIVGVENTIEELKTLAATSSGPLKINLELCGHAAERKLEWLKLTELTEGTKVRGFLEKRLLGNDEVTSPEFLEALAGKADTYTPKADFELNKAANALIDTDIKKNEFYNKLMKFTGDEIMSDTEVAAAKGMLNNFISNGDIEKAVDLANAVGRSGTATGRALRQYAVAKLTEPADLITAAQKFLKKHKLPDLDIDTAKKLTDLADKASKFATGSIEQADVFQEIYRAIGDLVPLTKLEILNSWRKLAMLANPKTQLKNVLANIFYVPLRKSNEVVSSVIERMLPYAENTQSLGWSFRNPDILSTVDEATKRAGLEMSNYGKWDLSEFRILSSRKPFGKSKPAAFLNKVAELNNKGLEYGDKVFFESTFNDSLGQLMTARGLTEVTGEATQHAMTRALDATFRSDNAISSLIGVAKKSDNAVLRTTADLMIPFVKTPSNLFIQAYKYSPANLAVSAAQLVNNIIKKGNTAKATADIINDFSKGITGGALLALGVYLGGSGDC